MRPCAAVLLTLAGAALAGPASGFTVGRPTGLMITVNSIDAATGDVDFDVSMTTTGTSLYGTIGSPAGFLGNRWSFQYTTGGFTVTNRYVWVNPSVPALDFGDGSTLADTTLSMVATGPPNVFTGSFTHTYPGPGTYDLRAGVCRFVGPAATVAPPAPGKGNLVTVGAGPAYPVTFRIYYLPTFPAPYIVSGYFTTPFVAGLTNGVDPQPGGGFGGVNVRLNVTDVPALPRGGLLGLAFLLGAGGVYLLRR